MYPPPTAPTTWYYPTRFLYQVCSLFCAVAGMNGWRKLMVHANGWKDEKDTERQPDNDFSLLVDTSQKEEKS